MSAALIFFWFSHKQPWLDDQLWTVLEAAVGTHIPWGEEGRGWETVLDVPVVGRGGHSFASWVVRLPVKQGGMGFRSLVDTSQVAFLGTVEQVIPAFGGPEGFCQQVEEYLGGLESFGEAAGHEGGGRWSHMLEHGGRLGIEVRRVWGELRLEGAQSAAWLDEELQGGLTSRVDEFGDGSTSGGTRRLIQEQVEQLRWKVLNKALENYQDQEARPCWSWMGRDKQSSSWLLRLNGLTGQEFSEAAATHLCLPSPACSSRLGEKVRGQQKIDLFGDTIRSAKLPGDGYRARHDAAKDVVFKQLQSAGMNAQCEVFNLFAREIPQEGLARIEKGRTRQSIVPDFRISIPEAEGREVPTLFEMKVISSCRTRYPRNPQPESRAVDRRADLLQGEYLGKARKVDQKYGGTEVGKIGGVERKLLSFPKVRGLVIGAWGEINHDFQELLQMIAESRLKQLSHQPGGRRGRSAQRTEAQQLANIVSQTRQQLSLVFTRGQATLLLDRLEGQGGGA